MPASTHTYYQRDDRRESPVRRVLSAFIALLVVTVGLVSAPSVALAASNSAILVNQVTIGSGSGPGGQLKVGDTISVSGNWDASAADPHFGDTFEIKLPTQLEIPTDVPFDLTGPRPDGSGATWATCLATALDNKVVCTLTREVEDYPALVHGEFSFDSEAVEVTTETALNFGLNGTDVPVELPGGGGIDDGIVVPDTWGKSGAMNDNNWSMTWKIDLPGSRMHGQDVINIADSLGAGHKLCASANLKVQTVRGGTVTDVTGIATLIPGADSQDFTIRLTAPQPAGFDPAVTYRVTYETCTPDGQIDPETTNYTNEATIDVWGESSGIIGVQPNPWQGSLTKSGTVLGGKDRNGKVAWTVTVPGDQLVGKTNFTFSEKLGSGHYVCPDTLSGITITERYGPSNQLQGDVTSKLHRTIDSSDASSFDLRYTITASDFAFKASDYRYVITYNTCVSGDPLPEGGTTYPNTVNVAGEIATGEAKVPARTDEKTGSINTKALTVDGVNHLPQTTLDWKITVPGERLQSITSDLVVTDQLTEAHRVCKAGDPTGGLASQLGLKVEAQDQIEGGGLPTVDLTGLVMAAHTNGKLTFTIPQFTLPSLPTVTVKPGFSTEYQFVITYTTCTTSGGMDAPKTVYGNTAEVASKSYEKSVTQENRGSGTGSGVPSGSVSIDKVLANTPGTAFVPADTTFTVHVQEFDPTGTEQVAYDLDVPLNGAPVSGLNARGNGWKLVLTEPRFPSVPGVTFGDPVFAPGPEVTVTDGGKSASVAVTPGKNISVAVTNTAQLGSVSIVKALDGGAASLVPADRTYRVTARINTSALGDTFPAQPDRDFDLTVGVPVALDSLPVGATVTFSEAAAANDDRFTWGTPTFSPQSVTITPAHATQAAAVTLTNHVERTVGTFTLDKTVTGEQSDNPAVPDEVTVTASWTMDGIEREKTITVPTDSTPVSLGENLLIGTKVTLTETPLKDGSSIAWGAPVWSGTGVQVSGKSAVVTIGRDPNATVSLENHAATSVAGISLIKGISGAAANEVDPNTEFPVTATWTGAQGAKESRTLTINPAKPTLLGVELPAGTVVTVTEGNRPTIDTVIWGSITISGKNTVDKGDGSAEITVSDQQADTILATVTNEATWAPGTFSVTKEVTGVSLNNSDVPKEVIVTASWLEDGETVTTPITVPTDGTVVPFGKNLPHGTEVTLTEESLTASSAFTWDNPIWTASGIVLNDDFTATITIGAATDNSVSLTNNARATVGAMSVLKTLSGEGATLVPAGTTFPVTATWTDLLGKAQRVDLELKAGEEAMIQDLPHGTEITLTEGTAELPSTVQWLGASWSSTTEKVVLDGDGDEVVIVIAGGTNTVAKITLDNEFAKVPNLPDTGSAVLPGALTALALLVVGGGFLPMIRRRA